jgi:hypothetical protein
MTIRLARLMAPTINGSKSVSALGELSDLFMAKLTEIDCRVVAFDNLTRSRPDGCSGLDPTTGHGMR